MGHGNCTGRQQFTPEQLIAKQREVDVLVGRGSTAVEGYQQIGFAEQTLYRWRKEYNGLKVDQARRMEGLERENARLKKLVADLALQKAILQKASKLTFCPPAAVKRSSRPAVHCRYRNDGPARCLASIVPPNALRPGTIPTSGA